MFFTVYDIVVFFFSVVLDQFFREIEPRGSHKIPTEGPVIFVAASRGITDGGPLQDGLLRARQQGEIADDHSRKQAAPGLSGHKTLRIFEPQEACINALFASRLTERDQCAGDSKPTCGPTILVIRGGRKPTVIRELT